MSSGSETVRVPRWALVIFSSMLGIVFTGLLGWMTSMNVSIQNNAIEIAAIKAQLNGTKDDLMDVRKGIDRLNDKIDSMLKVLVASKNTPPGN